MNLIDFLKKIISRLNKQNDEKYLSKNDPNSNVKVKDLTAKNLDLSYTAEDGATKKTGKVKSDLTPYDDKTQNIGSASKAWKNLYLSSKGLNFATEIPDPYNPGEFLNIKPFAIDSEGNLQIYFPEYGNHKAVTISKDGKIIIYNPKTKQKIVSIVDGFVEVFGNQSTNANEGQIQSFSLNTNLHRADLSSNNAMLATAGEFILIPEHGVFTENSVVISRYNRIKFGGRELTHFDVDRDDFVEEEVIFSYKKAGQSTDDVPDICITINGDIYYKGQKLEGLIASLAIPNYVKDSGDNRQLTFAYSKNGLDFNLTEWLAAWNGNELRKISKNHFLSTVSNQNLNSSQKYYARRNIGIDSYLDSEVIFEWCEADKQASWNDYYLSIKNNTSTTPVLMIWFTANTTYIVEICRRSILKQNKFGNEGLVNETFILSIPEYGGNDDTLLSYSEKTLSDGVNLRLSYEQEYETLEGEDGTPYDNYWADIYLDQIKNGTRLTGDNRIYEISKIVKICQKF